jgi:hypothetical protein
MAAWRVPSVRALTSEPAAGPDSRCAIARRRVLRRSTFRGVLYDGVEMVGDRPDGQAAAPSRTGSRRPWGPRRSLGTGEHDARARAAPAFVNTARPVPVSRISITVTAKPGACAFTRSAGEQPVIGQALIAVRSTGAPPGGAAGSGRAAARVALDVGDPLAPLIRIVAEGRIRAPPRLLDREGLVGKPARVAAAPNSPRAWGARRRQRRRAWTSSNA